MEFTEENKDLIEQLSNIDLNLVQKIIQAGLWFEFRTFYERTRGTEDGTVEGDRLRRPSSTWIPALKFDSSHFDKRFEIKPLKEFEWWWFGINFKNWLLGKNSEWSRREVLEETLSETVQLWSRVSYFVINHRRFFIVYNGNQTCMDDNQKEIRFGLLLKK